MMNVIALLILIICNSLNVFADTQYSPMSQNETYFVSNSAQCAADMKNPAKSFFILNNLLPYGVMLNNLKNKLKYTDDELILNGVKHYNRKLTHLTSLIIDKLISNQVPYVKTASDVLKYKHLFNLNFSENLNYKTDCKHIKDMTNETPQVYLREVNKQILEKIADHEFKNQTKNKKSCSNSINNAAFDLYPIYNFDFRSLTDSNWNKTGFMFWDSFKIYLSILWKNHEIENFKNDPYEKLTLMIPIEDLIIINSDGCESISRPECKSDFLSATEMRTLLSKNRTYLKMTDNSLQMKENIFYTNHKMESHIQSQLQYNNTENDLIQNLLNTFLGFKNESVKVLNTTVELFSAVLSKHSENKIIQDLNKQLSSRQNFEELHYMCSEMRLLKQGFFKIEDNLLKKSTQVFDLQIKTEYKPSQAVAAFDTLSKQVISFCDELDQVQIRENIQINSNWSNYKDWYLNFLKSYKSFKQDIEKENDLARFQTLEQLNDNSYVQNICSSAADCIRQMTEIMASLNKLAIHKNTFLSKEITTSNLFNENAEKVACDIYDPFEISKNNQKKLIYDIASSALFGYSSLPVFFDVNFKPKEIKSFNKRLDDNEIKFDVEMDNSQLKSSLALNFGALLDVPCAVSFSETTDNFMPLNSGYIFNGISVGACTSQKKESRENISSSIDSFKRAGQSAGKTCFECSINFVSISTIKSLNIFSPLRFLIKLIDSLIRYDNVKNSEVLNPKEYQVNKKILLETYLKHNKTIPNECVDTLKIGLPCAKNFCEAMAIREFEKQTGRKVTEISLVSTNNYRSQTQSDAYAGAWIKADNIKELNFKFICQNSRKFFKTNESALRRLR